MNKEQIELIEKFPKLLTYDGVRPTANKLDIREGWSSIVNHYFGRIQEIVDANKTPQPHILNMTDDYGSLTITISPIPSEKIENKIQSLIYQIKRETSHTCQECGDIGFTRKLGDIDIKTLCQNHYDIMLSNIIGDTNG